ncbi:MAG: M81 family metallopeptidase [Steroidobacteraceae bacterium]
MARIAVAGIQHETNTFAGSRATLQDFLDADAWPGLIRGMELVPAVTGINLPIAGAIDAARSLGHAIVPILWCAAQPSGFVTRDAFETLCAELLARLAEARPLDGVYLDLHGAMVCEHLDDADGELLARVRALLGEAVPVVASLDFHANAGGRQAHEASALVTYRSYPHVDMSASGERALLLLDRLIKLGISRPARALSIEPFLIPLTAQTTLIEPLRTLMHVCERRELADGLLALNLTPGFPLADVPHAGPAITGFGLDERKVAQSVHAMAAQLRDVEGEFDAAWVTVATAVEMAAASVSRGERPIVLADTQDNPGTGGDADTTTLLKACIAAHLPGVVAGVFCDAAAAEQAHAHGVGMIFEGEVAGRLGIEGETPLRGRFKVIALGDGNFTGTGPFYLGSRMVLGPMAQLEYEGARLVVASRKQQAADQAMLRHVGIDPATCKVLILKSSVHFRADFAAIAGRIVMVHAPGRSPADPASLRYEKLRPGVRLRLAGRAPAMPILG